MAAERLSMRTIKEVLRLKWVLKFTGQQIAQSCNIARSTVKEYLERALNAGLSWPVVSDLDDGQLESILFPSTPPVPSEQRNLPAMEYIHKELRRKGVTLRLLWLEYRHSNPQGYQYSQFCLLYRRWHDKLDVSLRQTHRAGEKLFVDYAGQTIPITDDPPPGPGLPQHRNAPVRRHTAGLNPARTDPTYCEAAFENFLFRA